MRLLGISGSLRRDSHNTRLLRAAAELAPPGVELELWQGLAEIPAYNEDDDTDLAPPAVREWRDAIVQAEGLVIATPEYNHSVPGALKNALDWASRPHGESALSNKPVAVVGASAGMFGAVWAQAELRKVLAASGARVSNGELSVGRAYEAFEDDTLADVAQAVGLAQLLVELAGDIRPAERLAA